MNPVIGIVGAGAVGCYYGGRLAQHGKSVHFLLRSGYEAAKANGLVVRSPDGDFAIPAGKLNAYRNAEEMPKVDLMIVTLKTTANDQYQPLIAPLLHDHTRILTLQNGLGNEDQLAALFGGWRILGGLAFVCINRQADGTIHHLDHGHIRIGEFSGPPSAETHTLSEMLNASLIRCDVLQSLRYGRWEKLVWNVPFNGLGAALDKTTDRLIATESGRDLVRRIMLEVIAIAATEGFALPPELPEKKIAETRTMGAYRTSMQIDRQELRPLEVDSILLEPLKIARANGVKTPCLEMLWELAGLP